MKIGCHLSIAKGYLHIGKEAHAIGANTFQFFSRNPRGGNARALNTDDLAALRSFLTEHGFAPILAHAPYTLNACSKDPHLREFAERVMAEDLALMEYLPGNYYNFHPGSHVGQGIPAGIELISEALNRILSPKQHTFVLLETMSGKGSEVGGTFEDLRAILDRVSLREKMGICLDTCHIYSAGYDIVNDLDGVLEQFDRIIGLNKLKAIHLNDSLTPFHSFKDRHARIGEGSIGLDAIVRIINHPSLKHLPFYLETPNEPEGHAKEIQLLKERWQG